MRLFSVAPQLRLFSGKLAKLEFIFNKCQSIMLLPIIGASTNNR